MKEMSTAPLRNKDGFNLGGLLVSAFYSLGDGALSKIKDNTQFHRKSILGGKSREEEKLDIKAAEEKNRRRAAKYQAQVQKQQQKLAARTK